MANTLKFGDGKWGAKKDSILAYNDENANFKPLPFTTSRASTATRINKAGLIEKVENGIPRVDYLGSTKGAMLLEPQSTNLIRYSEAFGNSYWTKSGATIQGDPSTAGSELVTNGSFTGSATGWTLGLGWSYGTNNLTVSSSTANLSQSGIVSVNKLYLVSYEISGYVSGSVNSNVGGIVTGRLGNSNQIVSEYIYTSSVVNDIFYITANSFTGSIDNVSVKEVQGFASPSAETPLGALKLVEDTSTGLHDIAKINFNVLAVKYNCSILVKPNGRNEVRLTLDNYFQGNTNAFFNLETGVISLGVEAENGVIETLSNGWFRCSFTSKSVAIAGSGGRLFIQTSVGNNVSYQGDGTSGVYIFGAQVEAQSYATSYIPNYGESAGVTRLAESCSQTPPDGVIGQTEGTMFIDVTGKTQVNSARYIAIGNIGDATNRLLIYQYSNLINVYNGAGTPFNITYNPPSGRLKMALAYSVGDYAFYVNGVQVFTNSNNAVPTCSKVSFGMNEITGQLIIPSIGYNETKLYNTRLSNSELQTLTTI